MSRNERSNFTLAALAATAMLTAGPMFGGSVSFTDDFNPPSDLWSNSTGDWSASGGDYAATVPDNNPFALTDLPFDMTDYTLNVTVNGEGDSGIMLRTNAANTQYVLLVLGGDGYGQGTRGGNAGSTIYYTDSSDPIGVFGAVDNVFTPGDTYTIEVTASGDTFDVYVDGASTPVLSFTDSVVGSSGLVGLYDDQPNVTTGSGSGTPTSYSDFSLTGSAVPEPTTGLLIGAGLIVVGLIRRRKP